MEREKGVDLWLDTVTEVARTRPDIVFVALGGGRLLDAVRLNTRCVISSAWMKRG